MTGDARRWTLCLMAALFVLGATAGSAQSIKVLVDGQLLATSAPPREVGGRIMVGMRDIFERLGAEVKWDAAERRITAMRGPRTVVLWIGRNVAYVDEAMIGLDVPPMLIGGYTYVPVRFPSEALGANVGWLSATRTVMIDTSTMPPLDGGPPPGPGPGPGPTTPTSAQGCFLQLVAATPRVILTRNYETDTAETRILAGNAVFQRGDASAAVLPVVQPEALQKGDDVKLMLNAGGQVERVEARFQLSQITYHAAAANSLMADTGQLYHLAADVAITREGVGPITLADLGAGEKLLVRQNPVAATVWEITAPKGTPPPPPTTGPQIFMIGAEGYTKPLKQGETLIVKLQGSPGGTATFDIGTDAKGLKLTENPAGVYSGSYRVKRTDEIVDAPLVGHLTVGGQEAAVVQSEDPVSLDAVAPVIEEYVPARDAVL
ncbi:MAG: copper amine oxidase N-terminal domain-containing protein, partial [Armatimonadetes bacterium]|nr:copper amine oxidase N-terminal domain-containing protein [Armatimonadota bacterium]